MGKVRQMIAASLGAFGRRFQALGLVARFSVVGFCVGLLLATVIAFLADRLLTDLLLVQLSTRAADQAALVFEEQMTPADFQEPVSSTRLADVATRLDPIVSQVRSQASGIIRLYIYSRDGTILYSDVVARRGRLAGEDPDLFNTALAGLVVSEVSPLTTGENADLRPRYGDALEVYVPFRLNGQIVGVYEIYQDLVSIRPVRPLVLGTVFGGFAVLFVALLLVVRGAADRLRRQEEERGQLEEQLRQSQKMQAFGQLAGGVAHDFNNLLTVIGGYSELLLDQNDLTPGQRQAIEQILQAGESASSLTRQLLAFSRREIIQTKEIDLNQIVERSAKMLRRLIGEDITFSLSVGQQPGFIEADPGQIEQILMNLAANARDAMARGGTLTIETANVDLDRAYAQRHPDPRPGAYVMLAVTDTGAGMDEATQARIFEPFFTTKEVGRGTGLGLAVVYGIVEQNKGSVEVLSQPGEGTTLKIFFPRIDLAAQSASPSDDEVKVPGGTETILLVDDAAPLRQFTRIALETLGYQVIEADSGERARELAESYPGKIDLLLTDIVMPGMSGRDIGRRLTVQRPGLKVLFMSGHTDDVVVRHGVVQGEIAFLQKPFTPSILARRVREVLDESRHQKS